MQRSQYRLAGRLPRDVHAALVSNSEQESKLSRTNQSLAGQGRKIFGYEIFVDNDLLHALEPETDWLARVRAAGEVETIRFNLDLNIPDLNGRNIQVAWQ